jgi:AraC-like DNA-binding protein
MFASSSDPSTSLANPVAALLVQGTKRLVFSDRVYTYGPGDFIVVAVDVPVTGQFLNTGPDSPALGVGLDLRADVIASLVQEQGSPADTGDRSRPGIDSPVVTGTATRPLVDAFVRMLRLLDDPASIPILAPMIEREIHWRLMSGDGGEVVRELGLPSSVAAQVGRIVRWIRENPAERIRIDDLAARAHMSPSTFHRHFRKVTTMSPVQFQKKVRLQNARLLLITDQVDVATAGFQVGYENPSQFSREYRREFGTSPGRDASRVQIEGETWAIPAFP